MLTPKQTAENQERDFIAIWEKFDRSFGEKIINPKGGEFILPINIEERFRPLIQTQARKYNWCITFETIDGSASLRVTAIPFKVEDF